jgi:hypothetical protein
MVFCHIKFHGSSSVKEDQKNLDYVRNLAVVE